VEHGLHPESWSYARRKLREHPEDPRALAFLAETALAVPAHEKHRTEAALD